MAIRDKDDIQAAHDRLVAIVLGEVPAPVDARLHNSIIAALDVLCWVLEHDHNETFANNLKLIDKCLAEHGLKLHRADAPFTYDELQKRRNANPS